MKVRSAIRTLTLVGASAAIVLPGAVTAAPTFGTWSASSGTITGCDTGAGWTCTTLVSEDGFLQQQVDIGSSTYFRVIVTDTGVSGSAGSLDFSGETFVEQTAGGSGNGVMAALNVNGSTSTGSLTSSATLQTGGFAGGGAGILINQLVTDDNGSSGTGVLANDDFSSSLLLDRNLATDDSITGSNLQLAQSVGLDTTTSQTGDYDLASFALRRVSGDLSTDTGDTVLPTGQGSTTTLGGTVDWTAGDDIVVTWIGQRISLDTLGMQYAGYQKMENLDAAFGGGAGTQSKDTFDFGATDTQAGPWDWGSSSPDDMFDTFGTAPSL